MTRNAVFCAVLTVLSLSSLFPAPVSAQDAPPPKPVPRIRRVGKAKIPTKTEQRLRATTKAPHLSVKPGTVFTVRDNKPGRSLKDMVGGPRYVTDGLTVRRFVYATQNNIALNVSMYDSPSRLSNNIGGDRGKTLIVLVPGADDNGTITDQDALCGKLAAELVSHGFLVAVPDYRKFNRGVAPEDYSGLFNNASGDVLGAIAILKTKSSDQFKVQRQLNDARYMVDFKTPKPGAYGPPNSEDFHFDSSRIVVAGLSYGGLLTATVAHSENVVGLAMGSGFIDPSDLTGFLASKNIPVAIFYNSNDQSVIPGISGWGAGGAAIAAELKRRGKTVYDSSVSTPCSDGNHVPVVGRDSEATVSEYVTAFAANIIKLVP